MKLTPSPIKIENKEGFTPEKDIFQRKEFGEKLYNLLENVDDELVLAIDAPWGEGKTTFVQMWRGLLNDKGVKSIYFDAYKNDFLEDPFLAIIGEIQSLLADENSGKIKDEFKNKAISALKVFGRVSLRVSIKAATAGVLDETVLEGAGTGKEVADIADKFVAERLESIDSDKKIIDGFKIALEEAAIKLGGEKKLVFIVDELDRCKPSFALHLLEKVKHVLSVPGVVFVLVLNREQMEQIIKSNYGAGIDSATYLQKFIHVWAGLPKSADEYNSDTKKYIRNCLSRMDYSIENSFQQTAIQDYDELAEFYNMSLREIERSLSNFAIIHNIFDGDLNSEYMALSIYLSIVKVRYPSAYKKIRFNQLSYEQVITETELESLEADYWVNDKPEKHPLRWSLKYYLSSDEDVKEFLKKGDFSADVGRIHGRTAINDICRWLDTFSK